MRAQSTSARGPVPRAQGRAKAPVAARTRGRRRLERRDGPGAPPMCGVFGCARAPTCARGGPGFNWKHIAPRPLDKKRYKISHSTTPAHVCSALTHVVRAWQPPAATCVFPHVVRKYICIVDVRPEPFSAYVRSVERPSGSHAGPTRRRSVFERAPKYTKCTSVSVSIVGPSVGAVLRRVQVQG